MRIIAVLCLLASWVFPMSGFAQTKNKNTIPKEDFVVTIKTAQGDMILLLYNQTPKHKANFVKLAQEGYYNGTTFHRVIKDFMIQGGDPNSKDSIPYNDGQGGPGYTVDAEFIPTLKHIKGALAAARTSDQVNPKKASSGSQFYIVHNDKGTPFLDGNYTVYGQVIKGLEVIDKIANVEKGVGDRPIQDVRMNVSVQKMKTKKIIKTYGCGAFYGLK
ncbi:MAG: peptidylprolyl isomerase [Cytophagaceae bacterium]|jgi:peptidylprolyl isomerase/peptidyl-prolyl cis-trans isomerase B (cyclophilin B)|nr:peptidylprolyl isomerase [Cytophagaceae bacterium]